MSKKVRIDPAEFGPGCKIDVENNRLIGASGTVYEDCEVSRESVERIIAEYQRSQGHGRLH